MYAAGKTPYQLSRKEPLPYEQQIERFVQAVQQAECIIVGGAPMELYDANPPKEGIREAMDSFLKRYHGKNLVILELGIGWRNQLIKAPLMQLTAREENATYITINLGEVYITDNIKDKSYGLDGYLDVVLHKCANLLDRSILQGATRKKKESEDTNR